MKRADQELVGVSPAQQALADLVERIATVLHQRGLLPAAAASQNAPVNFSAPAREGGVYPFACGAWGGGGLAKNPKNGRPLFHVWKKAAAKKFPPRFWGGGQGLAAEKSCADFGGRG